jgi:hypothetical protein
MVYAARLLVNNLLSLLKNIAHVIASQTFPSDRHGLSDLGRIQEGKYGNVNKS